DVYSLRKEDLLRLDLFKDKKAGNVLFGIEESKKRPLSRLLFALGIRHVGERGAEILAGHFNHIDKLMAANKEELNTIHEIGGVIAESVAQFFEAKESRYLIDKLKKAGVNMTEPKKEVIASAISGKTFVFTGELEGLTRSQAEGLAKKLGGRVSSSVSKKTDFCVAGENPGSKLDNAKKYGVKIIGTTEFKEMTGEKV
ncbi:MAG TPA: helix-hairpin-helix domain-containing protein, partial [Candidatus Omnitrophota bacterium]|nr:helix-hairpin-helix domain-containing protein [Candidatus Omnitrophota bacterium]